MCRIGRLCYNLFLVILGIIICCVITVAISVHSKLIYALILLSAFVMLLLMWNERMNILKLWAGVMIPYSILVLCGLNVEILEKYFSGNWVVIIFLLVAELFSLLSGRIVIVTMTCIVPIMYLLRLFATSFVEAIRIGTMNKLFGKFPNVRGIVRRDKKVYIYNDFHKKEVQIIYRQGHRKKILGTYKYNSFVNEHFSLEWEEEGVVTVRHYDDLNHKILMEKNIRLPRN